MGMSTAVERASRTQERLREIHHARGMPMSTAKKVLVMPTWRLSLSASQSIVYPPEATEVGIGRYPNRSQVSASAGSRMSVMKWRASVSSSASSGMPAVTSSPALDSGGKPNERTPSGIEARNSDSGTNPTSALPLATNWKA